MLPRSGSAQPEITLKRLIIVSELRKTKKKKTHRKKESKGRRKKNEDRTEWTHPQTRILSKYTATKTYFPEHF